MDSCYNDKATGIAVPAAFLRRREQLASISLQDLCNQSNGNMPLNRAKIRREISINGVKVWVTANNEQEYADKIIKLAGGYKQETKGRTIRFIEYADRWFNTYSKPNVEKSTAVNYRRQLDLHINPVIGNKMIADVTVEDVQKVFNRMGAKIKKETKQKVNVVLEQIFKLAIEERIIDYNPMQSSTLKIKGAASKETVPYTVEQMRYLAAHINELQDVRQKTWLALAISLPLRPEEILGLKWKDVDIDKKVLMVRGTVTHPDRNLPEYKPYTKTASSVRDLQMSDALISLLPEPGEDEDYVVSGKEALSYTVLRRMLENMRKTLKFEDKIVPRRFRTTVATDISAETKDLKLVQMMLGHSTPAMTLKHYDKGRKHAADAAEAIEKCYKLAPKTDEKTDENNA